MRIRFLCDVPYKKTTYRRGVVYNVDGHRGLLWIQEGRACFPTENRVKLPRENRLRFDGLHGADMRGLYK